MRFAAWPAVYLLALVPALLLLYAYALRRRREALSALVARDLAPRLLPAASERRAWLRALCLVGAVASLVVALMQPQWGAGGQELPLRGRDLIVLLDVSHSMLAEDVAPNRLAQAKAAAPARRGGAAAATVSACSPSPAAPTCNARSRATTGCS